jgi:hypothetical protein
VSVRLVRAFYSRLTADTGGGTNPLRTSVGDRIYQLAAPTDSTLPLVIFTPTGMTSENFFGGNTKVQVTIDLSCFSRLSSGPDALMIIEEQAFALLNQQEPTTASPVDRAFIRSTSRGVPSSDGEYLRVDSTFIVEGTDSSSAS